MIVRTKDGKARFYKGYTITGDGIEITDEAMLARLRDHALFIVGSGKKKKKPVQPKPLLAEKHLEPEMTDEEMDAATAPDSDR